ncbi:MAG: DUF488 domain-containing protein [Gemmatimonadaceae bacterium]
MIISSDTIWTVGHSTRTLEDFVAVLSAYDVELIADVRRLPASRRLPHFNAAELEKSLAGSGIEYKWLPLLGGRRQAMPGSPNGGWTNAAFRGYADHIGTEEFAEGFQELFTLRGGMKTAIMCAELLWWRCHRRIISDVLVSLDCGVVHIRDASSSERHRLVPPGRLVDGELTYHPDASLQLGLTFGTSEELTAEL